MKTPVDRAFARFSEIKSEEIHCIATGGADVKQRFGRRCCVRDQHQWRRYGKKYPRYAGSL
ncbi:MAG: hypothetical protein LBL45_06635 [Treponema sp.]|nr:hypothetical protein [Treponema sp.]